MNTLKLKQLAIKNYSIKLTKIDKVILYFGNVIVQDQQLVKIYSGKEMNIEFYLKNISNKPISISNTNNSNNNDNNNHFFIRVDDLYFLTDYNFQFVPTNYFYEFWNIRDRLLDVQTSIYFPDYRYLGKIY